MTKNPILSSLTEKFGDILEVVTLQQNGAEIKITHTDKEIHPQILFNFYNELYLLGLNIKVNVI